MIVNGYDGRLYLSVTFIGYFYRLHSLVTFIDTFIGYIYPLHLSVTFIRYIYWLFCRLTPPPRYQSAPDIGIRYRGLMHCIQDIVMKEVEWGERGGEGWRGEEV